MQRRSLLVSLLFLPLSLTPLTAFAADWQQPTPEELKMTAEPSAPNADAIYLYREDVTDNKNHMEAIYVRLKILRDEGKKYGDVELTGASRDFQITDIQGRTIHADGKVIPFTGKPYDKLLVKTKTLQYKAKVFSLPEVETGSILEYRYKLRFDDNVLLSPEWNVQQALFLRKAHFHYIPTDHLVISHIDKGSVTSSLAYSQLLPKGDKVVETRGEYDLAVENVPALPREEYEPPMDAFAYRVRFYYTSMRSSQEFWNSYGKSWSHDIDKFASPSSAINDAAKELTSGATTQNEKLNKLYDAVMKLENTRYSREHSKDENRAEGVKRLKSAADVLALKRGTPDELAMLFLALARAAGFHAEAMIVVDRDRDFFDQSYLDSGQLDDLIILVTVDGKERAFDPGERYATYGTLHWRHTLAGGLRQQDGHTAISESPSIGYKETVVHRVAELTLAPDGTITGSVTVICTGQHAMRWRQRALEGDQVALKKQFDEELRSDLPPGIMVQTDHFLGLDSEDTNLVVRMNVTGSLGTATGKRIFLPLSIFSAGSRDPFTSSHREEPIDLRYPFLEKDEVTLHLPDGFQVESVPSDARVDLPQNAVYLSHAKANGQTITYSRSYIMANILYDASEYDKLKAFFDDVSNKDRAQAVLHLTAAQGPAAQGH
ncbi:MAG TPA: transglutaminase domain-containing protein [Acidobacteriaceae bacterium]